MEAFEYTHFTCLADGLGNSSGRRMQQGKFFESPRGDKSLSHYFARSDGTKRTI